MKNKVAIVQNPPAYLDKKKTVALVVEYVEQAAKMKAKLFQVHRMNQVTVMGKKNMG